MRYLIIQAYIAESLIWRLELIRYSLISYVNGNINKATL